MAMEAYAKHEINDAKEDVTNFCEYSIVKVKRPYGFILFVMNCLLPGTGTFISSFMDT